MNQPRGIRNNNPGNIRLSGQNWRGRASADQQTDKEYVQFTDPKWGVRAMARILLTYKKKHGLSTPREIIGRWAPAADGNDAIKYAATIASWIGLEGGIDQKINLSDRYLLTNLVAAIIRYENGQQPYPMDDLSDWVAMA